MKIDKNKIIKDNAMLKHAPHLFDEWDFEKNNELGLDIYEVTYGIDKKAWWYCEKCDDSYPQRISIKCRGAGCSICTGRYVTKKNSLASLRPDIASQWHPTLNGDLTPHDRTYGSHEKVWWICEHGHEWEAPINARTVSGNGCKYCSGHEVWVGFNDMWTTNPELASLLANPEDGYKYTQSSDAKLNWKCLDCGNEIKNKRTADINKYGLSCSKCKDGIPSPEKVMYCLLKHLEIDFVYQKKFEWSKGKKYDFYVPSLNMIIETHGEQHINNSFEDMGGRTVREEQENDKYKRELALKNGIEQYIEIYCRRSEFEVIKNSILHSSLGNMIDLSKVDWIDIHRKFKKSIIYTVIDLWDKGMAVTEISESIGIHRATIAKYLKKAKDLNLCNYSREESSNRCAVKYRKRKIVQLDKDLNFIKQWDSSKDASIGMELSTPSSINNCCNGRIKTAYGYVWMHLDDYEELINNTQEW